MMKIMEPYSIDSLKLQLECEVQEIVVPGKRRLYIRIAKIHLKEVIKKLIESVGFCHLSTITGVDAGSEIELIYHLSFEDLIVSVKIQASKENLDLPSIVDLLPGAILYEREVHDLFGVKFVGNPDLAPLILPDSWPRGIYPLRKEWTLKKISEEMKRHYESS